MPRSANRRTVEIPAELYYQLAAAAATEGTTIATHLQDLVTDGRAHREWYGQIAGELAEIRRELRRLADRP